MLLSLAFSTIANADETKLENLQVEIVTTVKQDGIQISNSQLNTSNIIIYPNNSTQEKFSTTFSVVKGYTYTFQQKWKITNRNSDIIFRANKKYNVTLENGYYNIGYTIYDDDTMDEISSTYIVPKYNKVLVEYYDGKYEYFDLSPGNKIGRPTTLYLEFTPEKDVVSIEFILGSSQLDFTDTTKYYGCWIHTGEMISDKSFNVIVDTESVEAGLLSGIIGWIKNIYDTIVNLPSKIWEFISEGLKGLFVPDEDSVAEYKDRFDGLLADKFGAVYQVVNLLFESWDDIKNADLENTVDIPEVVIPLPDDNEFTFGGYSVVIVPEGFEFMVNAIKIIVGISCTVLFVNGLRKRYEDVMG